MTVRVVILGLMVAVSMGLLAASWAGSGAYRKPAIDDRATRAVAVVQKRVDDRRRFAAGLIRGKELVAYQDSLAIVARNDSLALQREAESAEAIAAGRPDPHRPVIRSTPTYGGGPSYGK